MDVFFIDASPLPVSSVMQTKAVMELTKKFVA
jgi:hypothetical protein